MGGLNEIGDSSAFLYGKFHYAGLKTPASEKLSYKQRAAASQYIFDAANGLMKQLNALGLELAAARGEGHAVTLSAIETVCEKVIKNYRLSNRGNIKSISKVLAENVDYHDVFQFLVSKSTSSITRLSEIEENLSAKYRDDSIRSALEFFEESNIIVTTGSSDIRIFFKDPPLFNCIKTHLRDGARYGWDPHKDRDTNKGIAQISLGLRGGRRGS